MSRHRFEGFSVSAVDQGNTSEEFRRDCLARWLLEQPQEQQLKWAKRQTPSLKNDIRERMIRMKQRGNHGN